MLDKVRRKSILFIANEDWFFASHRMELAKIAIENNFDVHLATKFNGLEKYML